MTHIRLKQTGLHLNRFGPEKTSKLELLSTSHSGVCPQSLDLQGYMEDLVVSSQSFLQDKNERTESSREKTSPELSRMLEDKQKNLQALLKVQIPSGLKR